MQSSEEPDLKQRLKELEIEVEQNQALPGSNTQPISVNNLVETFLTWYRGLTGNTRIIVIAIGLIAGLAIFTAVLQLLLLSVRLAVTAVVLYLAYRIFVAVRKPKP